MDRYIRYKVDNNDEVYGAMYFGYDPNRKNIEKAIVELAEKDKRKNIQVIKTKYTTCTCKKCGNTHKIPHESIDESFVEFINSLEGNTNAK